MRYEVSILLPQLKETQQFSFLFSLSTESVKDDNIVATSCYAISGTVM